MASSCFFRVSASIESKSDPPAAGTLVFAELAKTYKAAQRTPIDLVLGKLDELRA